MIESTADERVSYEFTASGRVEPGPQANLAETEGPDAINGNTASGSVALRGRLHFSGEITALSLDGGDAQVELNSTTTIRHINPTHRTWLLNAISSSVVNQRSLSA